MVHNHPYPVQIMFAPDAKAWKQLHVDGHYPANDGLTSFFDNPDRIVITLGELDADDIGIVVHEAVHVTHGIESVIKGRLDIETEAYLVQAVTAWLIKCIAKAGRGHFSFVKGKNGP